MVIDEVQRQPALLPALRVLVDRPGYSGRFLLLGSASPELVRHASESLAGGVEFIDMGGFSLDEVGADAWQALRWRGGFPRSVQGPTPWFENLGERQRKAPKAYVRDSGLLHSLLGIGSPERLLSHDAFGASFEGFALNLLADALPARELLCWSVQVCPALW